MLRAWPARWMTSMVASSLGLAPQLIERSLTVHVPLAHHSLCVAPQMTTMTGRGDSFKERFWGPRR